MTHVTLLSSRPYKSNKQMQQEQQKKMLSEWLQKSHLNPLLMCLWLVINLIPKKNSRKEMQSSKLHTAKEFCGLICQICSGYLSDLFIYLFVLVFYLYIYAPY